MASKSTTIISVRVPNELAECVKLLADLEGKNVSEWCVPILLEYVRNASEAMAKGHRNTPKWWPW